MTEEARNTIQNLTELIEAIDRRLPQMQRAGEAVIANAAMRLRIEARSRLEILEVATRERESDDSLSP